MVFDLLSFPSHVANDAAVFRSFSPSERSAFSHLESLYPLADGQWILEGRVPSFSELSRQIGSTPLVGVDMVVDAQPRRVQLKLEGFNPGGSIKDRTALSLLASAERAGQLTQGSIILESTSGNLGVALALLGRSRGYRFCAVIDPKTSWLNVRKMEMLGACLDLVDQSDGAGGYLLSRLQRVNEHVASSSKYLWMNQYANEANPDAHFQATGPEILSQTRGALDAVFIAVSTCGTLAGIGRFLRANSPHTRIVAVDAVGSAIFGQEPAPRKLTGIGSSRVPEFSVSPLVDEVVFVRDDIALESCRSLAAATGIMVGGSSGAVLGACNQYLTDNPTAKDVVCLCPDTGRNYDTIFLP